MKKILKYFFISVLLIILIFFSFIFFSFIFFSLLFVSCDQLYEPKTIPEKSLVILTGRDSILYTYQDKVNVTISYSANFNDRLKLRTSSEGESWGSDSIVVLSGTFEKVGWYDDNLFILMDKKYYSLDIDEYEVPPLDEDGETQYPEYELKEYSESQFKILYPDYESFDWYGH